MAFTRRDIVKAAVWVTVFGVPAQWARAQADDATPAEPENLDEPTQWQEGDPKPVETTVPTREPEQTSQEAPPSQPMDDDRGDPPSPDHVWATGYWWWTNGGYSWVPGYWVTPPEANLAWVAGYWHYQNTQWVFVQGGWGRPNTTVVVVQPDPRPLLTAFIITAPRRIIRRNRYWGHHPHRRHTHHVVHHRPATGPGGPGRPGKKPAAAATSPAGPKKKGAGKKSPAGPGPGPRR